MKKKLLILLFLPCMAVAMDRDDLRSAIENHDQVNVLRALVRGADINRLDPERGLTPPIFAVKTLRKVCRRFIPSEMMQATLTRMGEMSPRVINLIPRAAASVLQFLMPSRSNAEMIIDNMIVDTCIDFELKDSRGRTFVDHVESMQNSWNPCTRWSGRRLLKTLEREKTARKLFSTRNGLLDIIREKTQFDGMPGLDDGE